MTRLRDFLSETHGRSLRVTAKILCNKLIYASSLALGRDAARGRVHTDWHWLRFPFSLREEILWSAALQAWFWPLDESAMECMLHMRNYEPVDWVAPSPGDVFLDVGGYVGWYSIQAARAVGPLGKVVALEPDPVNRTQLLRNLELNGVRNADVMALAAWSKTCKVNWRRGEEPVWHRVGESSEHATQSAVALDELVEQLTLDRVNWIKMDIEGGETEALRGASGILRRFRPNLFIEIHETKDEVLGYLKGLGYSVDREQYDQLPDRHGWILARCA